MTTRVRWGRSDPRWAARWALVAFLVTELITRIITTTLHLGGAGTSGGVIIGGVHIHHMIFGLTLLAVLSVLWLLRQERRRIKPLPLWEPIAFGIAWALILDESALLLNLKDVYWLPEGGESWIFIGAFVLLLGWLSFRPLSQTHDR